MLEEWVGSIWHNIISKNEQIHYHHARVDFADVSRSVGIIYRALGGCSSKRIEAAAPREYLTKLTFRQKISGQCQQQSLAWQDDASLRLPESLSLLPSKKLNRELYLWLAALAAQQHGKFNHWGKDNQRLVAKLLASYAGLNKRYEILVQACLQNRTALEDLPEEQQPLELAIRTALLNPTAEVEFPAANFAPQPVLLWLYPCANTHLLPMSPVQDVINEAAQSGGKEQYQGNRKKAERIDENDSRSGLILFRLDNLFSWSEMSQLDRCSDDSDDDDAQSVAQDLDKISVSNQRNSRSAKLKMDLDLPSAIEDDTPLGGGILLPEWDHKTKKLKANYCRLQPMLPKGAVATSLPVRLQAAAKKARSQFEQVRNLRHWQRAQNQGEEIDLNAWLDFHINRQIEPTHEKGLYQQLRFKQRDLCCLLLADLSMSTDAYVDNQSRVIDVVKDSMLIFGEALNAVGDAFAMYGFSSVKRSHVRFSMLKNFQEQYSNDVRGRIQALKPGFHTRMGPAIRQATHILADQAQSKKLLLILTDGKPNDIDCYEGVYGIEDTRAAILEAKKAGLQPFCITVDQQASEYLPYLFGSDGFTVIHQPTQLPNKLPQLYYRLTE